MFDLNKVIKGYKNNSKNVSTSKLRKMLLGVMMASIVSVILVGATTQQSSLGANNDKNNGKDPTEGYNIHAIINRHDSQNLDHKMDHYCKLDTRIVAVCQLYAGDGPDAQLAQIEFIITDAQYDKLPPREKQNWHNHAVELTPQRGEPEFVSLPKGVEGAALLKTLQQTYGKVVTLWDPNDDLPSYPPYVFSVDSPFALGQDKNDNLENEWKAANLGQ